MSRSRDNPLSAPLKYLREIVFDLTQKELVYGSEDGARNIRRMEKADSEPFSLRAESLTSMIRKFKELRRQLPLKRELFLQQILEKAQCDDIDEYLLQAYKDRELELSPFAHLIERRRRKQRSSKGLQLGSDGGDVEQTTATRCHLTQEGIQRLRRLVAKSGLSIGPLEHAPVNEKHEEWTRDVHEGYISASLCFSRLCTLFERIRPYVADDYDDADTGHLILTIQGCHVLRVWDSATFSDDPVVRKIKWRGIYEKRWLQCATGISTAPDAVLRALSDFCPPRDLMAFYAGWARFCVLLSATLELIYEAKTALKIETAALLSYALALILPALEAFEGDRDLGYKLFWRLVHWYVEEQVGILTSQQHNLIDGTTPRWTTHVVEQLGITEDKRVQIVQDYHGRYKSAAFAVLFVLNDLHNVPLKDGVPGVPL